MAKNNLSDNFYEKIKPRLQKRIGRELRVARHILGLGCGSRELVPYLAETYQQEVTGVDISAEHFPRSRHSHHGVRFHCLRRDATRLRFATDRSVDAVVMVWALHEMDQPLSILAEVQRVLRPGGEVVIVDFPRDSLAQKLWNEDYYHPEEVKVFLAESEFADIHVRVIERGQVIWAKAFRPTARSNM